MATLEERISALEAEIEGYKAKLDAATTLEEKKMYADLINGARTQLHDLQLQLQQQQAQTGSGQGQLTAEVFTQAMVDALIVAGISSGGSRPGSANRTSIGSNESEGSFGSADSKNVAGNISVREPMSVSDDVEGIEEVRRNLTE